MKKILSLLVLSSVMICPVTNVYAKDGQTNLTKEVQQKAASELQLNIPNVKEGERLQIRKGSSLYRYGVTCWSPGMSEPFAGFDISNFDNEKLGDQDVVVIYGDSTAILPVTVIAGQAPTEITSIKPVKDDVFTPLNEENIFNYLKIDLYDAMGRRVRTDEPNAVFGHSGKKLGKQSVTVEYKGLKTYMTVSVGDKLAMPTPQRVAVGGKLNTKDLIKIVDMKDNDKLISTVPIEDAVMSGENPEDAWFNNVDTSEVGVETIEFDFENSGNIYTTSINIISGIPQQGALLESARSTIPTKKKALGTWKLPLGDTGAGKWYFNTELAGGTKLDEGTDVDVYYYNNNKWSKMGTYTTDENGSAVVEFTKEQLAQNSENEFASVLLTKSGEEVNDDEESTTSNGDKNSTDGTASGSDTSKTIILSSDDSQKASSTDKKATNNKSASVKTGDKANTPLFGAVAMAGVVGLYLSKKKR